MSAWLGDDGHPRVYLRRYIRFAEDYDQGNLSHTGGSLEGVAGNGKWDGMGQAGKRPRGDDRFSCRLEPWRDWGRSDAPGTMFLYTYWMDMARDRDGNFWGNMLQPPPERRRVPKRGAWVCLEQMIQVNTVGQADGEVAAWIDGELYLHCRGIRWRADPRLLVKRFELGVYVHAAARDNTVWYDDVVVSTGYVGPLAAKAKPGATQSPDGGTVAPRPATKGWIWFEDRNAARPPTLVLTLAGGEVRRVAASADTTLIAYLADRAWGALELLSIDTVDQNRVLLTFDLGDAQGIEAAHLELELHQSALRTDGALALAVHPLLEGFEERSATWSHAPRFDDQRAALANVGPAEGAVSIDVTALVTSTAGEVLRPFGLLLKAAQPLAAATEPPSAEAKDVEDELRAMFTWAPDLDAALAALPAEAEARYWCAALAAARGERSTAERALSALEDDARESHWALKARARRVLPAVVEGFEVLTPTTRPTGSVARIRAAVDGLCLRQLPDGSFPMGTTPYEPQRLGVTVLAAHALSLHGRAAEEERARLWIVAQLATTATSALDSFAAAYWLDYMVARATRGLAALSEVTASIELLLAGQMTNGAWSYNKDFGEGWSGGFGGHGTWRSRCPRWRPASGTCVRRAS